jgi:DNA-binding NtrC family response regulator
MKVNLVVIDDDPRFRDEPFFVDVKEVFPNFDIKFFENSEKVISYIAEKISATEKIIVLLDLGFPRNSKQGTEILKKIREESYLIPVIILTAADENLNVSEELINYKATAFLRKDLQTLKKIDILKRVVDYFNLDIPSAIDDWIESNPEKRRNLPFISTSDGKTYTLNEILNEIRRETIVGREFSNNLLKLTVDLVSRNKEKLHG